MTLSNIKRNYINKVHSVGKIGLNALFPNDFELYVFALELVDSKGDVEEYFIFPINPTSIEESSVSNQTITKTAGGVVVMNSNTFIPRDIIMSGNFGRRFKMLIGQELMDFASLQYSSVSGFFKSFKGAQNVKKSVFNPKIKTGYGLVKVLETIVNKSQDLDQFEKPYSLHLYNLALGNNYLIKATGLTYKQDIGSNMIWNYTLQIKAIGDLDTIEGIRSQKSLSASLATSAAMQRVMSQSLNKARQILKV